MIKNILNKYLQRKRNLKEIHGYWKDAHDEANKPEEYLIDKNHIEQEKCLIKFMKICNKNSSIFEIGCNVGWNLNFLYKNEYNNLYGLEINNKAIQLMKLNYPKMYENSSIIYSSIENKIKSYKDNEFDCVFTIAVLQHIHPESSWIFKEISRITKKYLMIVENELDSNWRVFNRNYKVIFEELGFKQIEEYECGEDLERYKMRIFKK